MRAVGITLLLHSAPSTERNGSHRLGTGGRGWIPGSAVLGSSSGFPTYCPNGPVQIGLRLEPGPEGFPERPAPVLWLPGSAQQQLHSIGSELLEMSQCWGEAAGSERKSDARM